MQAQGNPELLQERHDPVAVPAWIAELEDVPDTFGQSLQEVLQPRRVALPPGRQLVENRAPDAAPADASA